MGVVSVVALVGLGESCCGYESSMLVDSTGERQDRCTCGRVVCCCCCGTEAKVEEASSSLSLPYSTRPIVFAFVE